MNSEQQSGFIERWNRYFGKSGLPVAFWFTDEETEAPLVTPGTAHRCLIASLSKALTGTPMRFGADSIACGGGRRYCGFGGELRPEFPHFLSYGIPGKVEGERYKKSPELVEEMLRRIPVMTAPRKYLVLKRWDLVEPPEEPDAVIFVANPEVVSGLFTLSNFDEAEPFGVIAPFGAGCASIIQYPYLEQQTERPRCVVGMFDPSARPFIPMNAIGFAIPMRKFSRMIGNMDESFLTTHTWDAIRRRIDK
jgi:hypothetical protein